MFLKIICRFFHDDVPFCKVLNYQRVSNESEYATSIWLGLLKHVETFQRKAQHMRPKIRDLPPYELTIKNGEHRCASFRLNRPRCFLGGVGWTQTETIFKCQVTAFTIEYPLRMQESKPSKPRLRFFEILSIDNIPLSSGNLYST